MLLVEIGEFGIGRFLAGRGSAVTTSVDNETTPAIGTRRAAIGGRSARIGSRRSLRQRLRLPLMLAGPLAVLLAAAIGT